MFKILYNYDYIRHIYTLDTQKKNKKEKKLLSYYGWIGESWVDFSTGKFWEIILVLHIIENIYIKCINNSLQSNWRQQQQ